MSVIDLFLDFKSTLMEPSKPVTQTLDDSAEKDQYLNLKVIHEDSMYKFKIKKVCCASKIPVAYIFSILHYEN